MNRFLTLACLLGCLSIAVFSWSAAADAAEVPSAPEVSSFAPANDLVPQIDAYIADLEEAVASESEYKDSESNVKKDANVLILLSIALGVHDADNKYQKAAPAMLAAAKKLAAAADYAQAKAAVAELKQAATASGDPSTLSWSRKEAGMKELMEAVPLINSRLKRYMRRFDRSQAENAQYSAVIAVIGQGSMANAEDTDKPGEVEKWFKYCAEMRDAAAAVNKAVNAKDEKAAEKAMEALQKSCDDCHAIFHPGVEVE
jgi:hypothetical protein